MTATRSNPGIPLLLLCLVVSLCAAPARAQSQKLRLGDPAPGIDLSAWINGEETRLSEGSVYVVVFWSATDGRSERIMRPLTELQEKYAPDLTVLAIAAEDAGAARAFLLRNKDRMKFVVGVDRDRTTWRAWMEASERSRMPMAFIVDRAGKIQFIGDPSESEFEDVLGRVVAGRYDTQLFRSAQGAINAARQARRVKNWRLATQHYTQLLGTDRTVFAEFALEQFEMILLDMDQTAAAYAMAKAFIDEEYSGDARFLMDLALRIAGDPRIPEEKRDFTVAFRAAGAAAELLPADDPRRLSTLAAVNYHAGKVAEAITLQRSAWRLARPELKERLRRDLEMYQAAQRRSEGAGTPRP